MAQQVKDPTLSLLWLGSLLWHRFNPWPWNFYMLQVEPKEKKKKNSNKKPKTFSFTCNHRFTSQDNYELIHQTDIAYIFFSN